MRRHEPRHLCLGCREHRALYLMSRTRPRRSASPPRVRADRDHTLCFRCYRAEVNRLRARRLAA